jgi:phthalate 4,5-dioxygenase
MLSHEDNELLVRTNRGTAMGDVVRSFWIPALLASEVAENDCRPVRIRLLGENLIAFRDNKGAVGLMEEHCPHRRASLALGANEDGGVRCLYHGWKFAVDGQCLDTPTEPANSTLCKVIRAVAYPVREAGGVIWAYMGPAEKEPPFPAYEWLSMPGVNAVPFKTLEDCNYAQAVEGTIDSAHAGVLHKEDPWAVPGRFSHEKDLRPKLEIEFTPYGLRYGAVRKFNATSDHVRITQVMLPFFTLIPPDGFGVRKYRRMANAFVPRDDESTWHIQWFFDHSQPVDVAYRIDEGGHWIDENFRKKVNIDNWYGQTKEAMTTENFSGIRGIMTQDHAVSETQGRILDRTKEHLGTSDIAVVAWRRLMLKTAKDAATLTAATNAAAETDWSVVKAATVLYPTGQHWKEVVPLGTEGAHLPVDEPHPVEA